MLEDAEMNEIQKQLMCITKGNALDGDELEELQDYLKIANGDIIDVEDKYYCAFHIHKDDLRSVYTNIYDENKKHLKEIDSLTDEEMKQIAKKYQDVITLNDQWDLELAEVFEKIIKERRE